MQNLLFPDLPPASDKGLGGAEVAAIFGLSPMLSPRALWARKTGRETAEPPRPAQLRGVRLESRVKALFEAATGRRVRSGVRARHRRWHEDVRMIAATDGMLERGEVFEAKTTLRGTSRAAAFESGRPPRSYALQIQHYAAVTGASGGVICCLVGPEEGLPWPLRGCALHSITWERDEAIIDCLEGAVRGWFRRHILGDEPPEGPAPETEVMRALLAEERRGWIQSVEHTRPLVGAAFEALADGEGLR